MRAQVSVETLLAIAAIMILFILVLASVAFKNSQAEYYQTLFKNQSICNKLSLAISLSFASGKKNFSLFVLDNNATIYPHSIDIGNYSCDFIGTAIPTSLLQGTIKIKNNSGVVEFEQVS
jgi:hypothetical protein